MQISYIDVLILLPILIGLVRGLMRGIVTEVIAILGVIIGLLGARIWGGGFAAWLVAHFTWPEAVCRVVAYSLVFLGIAIVCNLIGRLFSRLLHAIHLGWLNRMAGGAFGALKYGLVVLAVVYVVNLLDTQFQFIRPETKSQSVCYYPTLNIANSILSSAKKTIS